MRRLIVQSNCEESDRQAAGVITQEMVRGDTKEIIWYSKFGEKIAQLDQVVTSNAEQIAEVLTNHHCTVKTISDLRTQLINLKIEQDETKKKLTDLVKSLKEDKKKKEEQKPPKTATPAKEKA